MFFQDRLSHIVMQVKSIAECSWGAFCNSFDLQLAPIRLNDLCCVYLWVAILGRFYLIVLLSALDKLLGQLGIYATWLSSIAYLQKQLRIFIFFTPCFFCDYTFAYCMKPSGMCLYIYSLPSSAFLKYQNIGFYCTWSKSHLLVDIWACAFCISVSLSS